MAQVTEKQEGIRELRALFRKFNGIIVGDKGILKAYRDLLKKNKIKLEDPTTQQGDYESLMGSAAPLMEPNMRQPRPKGD